MDDLTVLIKPAGGACGLRCRYCFYNDILSHRQEQGGGFMLLSTADALIEKAVSAAQKNIVFAFQGGEPTLMGLDFFKHFVRSVIEKNDKRITVSYTLQTNGQHLDREFVQFFYENKFLVGLSMDGPADIHDALRVDKNGKGTLSKTLAAAALLKQNDVPFNILCVVTRYVARHAAKVYHFFKKHGFTHLQFIPCLDGLDGKTDRYSLTSSDYAMFLRIWFDLWQTDLLKDEYISIRTFDNYVRMIQGYPPENCAMEGRCGVYFVVDSDGSVYPCDFYCVDEYRLGSIIKSSFEALSNTDAHKKFVAVGANKAAACTTCTYLKLCRGGCKREKAQDTHEYRFCAALQQFFEYAYPKMTDIAIQLTGRGGR